MKRGDPETVYILAKRNYKVHANIGFDRRSTARFASVCDTGAGASFIRKGIIPEAAWPKIQPIPNANHVRDANNRQVNICGIIELFVDIGGRGKYIHFNVVERLATEVIIGCDYCDDHVEYIRPRKQEVELADGTIVPIIRQPDRRAPDAVPLPPEQE